MEHQLKAAIVPENIHWGGRGGYMHTYGVGCNPVGSAALDHAQHSTVHLKIHLDMLCEERAYRFDRSAMATKRCGEVQKA